MKRFVFVVMLFLFAPLSATWAANAPTEIDLATAKSLYDKGIVFIDARRPNSYNYAHIPGAVNLSVTKGQITDANLSKLVTKDKSVVFYCNCGRNCHISNMAALKANELGYQDVYFINGAINKWEDAGFKTNR